LTNIPFMLILNVILFAILIGMIVYFMIYVPSYSKVNEPFYGGVVRGSGHPDCLRTLPEASEILDTLLGRIESNKGASEGSADYREFQLILSKLACLKKDLLSPSGIVEATRYQAFETAHDRINVAEVCAMCLNKSIPPRDLDIIFATWRDRGKVLLRKLCTEAQLNESVLERINILFAKLWNDVYDISKSRCLKIEATEFNGRDIRAFEPENLKDLRNYTNKYGGLSASGWNGNV